jgi:hypothetical protein
VAAVATAFPPERSSPSGIDESFSFWACEKRVAQHIPHAATAIAIFFIVLSP